MAKELTMETIVTLCKQRGFIFPSSEIYGGLSSSYTYGQYGAQLKKNIKDLWWKTFVESDEDTVGIDGPIFLHPKLWEASGHLSGFNDAMVDCKECQKRFRADHVVEELTGKDMEGDLAAMTAALQGGLKCPNCGKSNWTEAKNINMMFKTDMNGINEPVYLRPETAGAIFIAFLNVINTSRVKIPFAIAQIGKAFRNEIVTRNFIFRLRELEQMEIEYFFDPEEPWEAKFEEWLQRQEAFTAMLGLKKENVVRYEHAKEKLCHYSKKTVDLNYKFPFGWGELYGMAHRGNFDLTAHSNASGEKLEYYDQTNNKRYIPHVLEPTFGVERSLLATICAAYNEEEIGEEKRVVLKFPKYLAPVKIAIFPLLKNRPELVAKAKEIFHTLKSEFTCEFDDNGNIGKRYRRQDEIGTPYCVTFDFESLEDHMVTVRDRDTMVQERVTIAELKNYFEEKFAR